MVKIEFSLGFGWCLAALALLQLPLWAAYVVYKQEEGFTILEVILHSTDDFF